MAKTLDQVGIETGNTVEAYHVTQSIDAFTGAVAYDISLSGSFNMTGSINGEPLVINPLTASYAITASYAENALSASYAVSASYEIIKEVSSSHADFADTASYVENAQTASYVNLIAGDNITINQVGTSFEISSSAGGGGITPAETGSFIVTASATNNVITFTQGDGSTFPVTIDTGSGGNTFNYSYVETQNYTFPVHPDNSSYTLQTKDARFSLDDPAGNSIFFLPDFVTEIGQVIEIFYFGGTGTLQISASAVGTGASIFLHRGVGGSSTAGGTVTTNNSGEACYFKLMATSGSLGGGIGLSGTLVSNWRISNYWDDTLITTIDIVVADQLTLA